MTKLLIPKTLCLEYNKRAHLLPLKRKYRTEMHRTEPSFSTNFMNKENNRRNNRKIHSGIKRFKKNAKVYNFDLDI